MLDATDGFAAPSVIAAMALVAAAAVAGVVALRSRPTRLAAEI
jgi:hypothetical protein